MGYTMKNTMRALRPASLEIKTTDDTGRDLVIRGDIRVMSINTGEWGDVHMELSFEERNGIQYTIEYPDEQIKAFTRASKHFEEFA